MLAHRSPSSRRWRLRHRSKARGLGTQLMHHAMEEARTQGCYKLALSSNVKREKAHDFYDNLGFTRHGYSFVVDLSDEHH